MVALIFNVHGFVFQQGVQILGEAYHTASDALSSEWERAQDEARAYINGVEAGEIEWIGERDEDGFIIWDREQENEYQIEAKRDALQALRKAFVIAIYHHWERSARSWSNDDKRDHAKLVKSVQKMGYPLHPRLEAVRDLANLLKHDNSSRGEQLRASWPEVIRPRSAKLGRPSWYDMVLLTDAHLSEAFNIIAASGPRADSVATASKE